MAKNLFIVQKESGSTIYTTGTLSHFLIQLLTEHKVDFKRKDVITYAEELTEQLNGQAIDIGTFNTEMEFMVEVFRAKYNPSMLFHREMYIFYKEYLDNQRRIYNARVEGAEQDATDSEHKVEESKTDSE